MNVSPLFTFKSKEGFFNKRKKVQKKRKGKKEDIVFFSYIGKNYVYSIKPLYGKKYPTFSELKRCEKILMKYHIFKFKIDSLSLSCLPNY